MLRLISLDLMIIKRIRNNISTELRKSLQELRSLNDHKVTVQDKGSKFVSLSNEQHCEKFIHSFK